MTSIGTPVVRCPRSASRLSAVPTSSPWPTFGRSAPTERRASVRCVRASSTAVSRLAARRPAAALPEPSRWRRLQLHQDRREPLREIVVNVARKPVALLENRLAALFEPAALGEPALMERERRLARDRFEEGDAPRTFAFRHAARRQSDPAEIASAQHQRSDRDRGDAGAAIELTHRFRQPIVESVVLDRARPSRLMRIEMIRHALARQLEIAPVRAPARVELIDEVGEPQLAAMLVFVDQPHAARMALAQHHERLCELGKKPFDVGFAYQEIERELNGAGLNLHHALGVTPRRGFACERRAKHIRIG